jgi:diguanylate cyclase (GGDEF)-like protein/PAS domain S-box-containing protein
MHATRDDSGPVNVLIVIEDQKFRLALAGFLRSESITPLTVETLEEARTQVDGTRYDLVFVSETIDDLRAGEIPEAVRLLPGARDARVVAVSTSRTPAVRHLHEAGFDAVVGPTSSADEIAAQTIIAGRPGRTSESSESPAMELPAGPGQADPPLALSSRALDILATLKALGFYLSHDAPVERKARHALRAIEILFPGASSAIWLRASDRAGQILVPGADLPSAYPEVAHRYYGNLDDDAWEELGRSTCFVANEAEGAGTLRDLFALEPFESVVHLGLTSSERTIGVLAVYFTSPGSPGVVDMTALETIASMTTVAMAQRSEPTEPREDHAPGAAAAAAGLQWKQMFEHFPDAAFLIDGDGMFVATNAALSQLAGISPAGIGLLSILDLVDDRDAERVRDCLEAIVLHQSCEILSVPVGFRRDGETIVPLNLFLSGLPSAAWNGTAILQGVLRDAVLDGQGVAQFEALRDIARIVATERDVETAVSGILNSLSRRLGYSRAAVWTVSRSGTTLRLRASLTNDVPEILPVDHEVAAHVLRTWEPELVINDGSCASSSVIDRPSGSIARIPVVHADRVLGVMQIEAGSGQPIRQDDLEFLLPVAVQIAGIIERDSLFEYLEQQAMTDQVTGLPNRQAFQRQLDEAVASGTDGVSVLVIGIDGFKDINEIYGHVVADVVLRQVGTVLQSHMSPGQLLARYTSDQFAALLPGIDRDEAVCIAERLRIDVGTHLFTVAEQVEQLTVSIGAATCPDDAETSQAVMQAADHAMYLAKRAGRNQTFQSNAAFATLAPAHGRINDLLRQSPRETLSLLIRAMDQRLPERAGHSKRVTRYVMAIARELEVPSASLPRLRLAAYIHDIGMVSLPDSLLRKPGQLSAEERSLLRGVPVAAHGLLSQLDMHESILLAVLHQRENYDGTGYPAGLRGESIPLGSRIIAVADALDAMTSARAHREPMSLEQALEQVSQQSGRQFDPQVVEAAYCLTEVISESVTLSPHEDAEGAMAMPGVPSEMRS